MHHSDKGQHSQANSVRRTTDLHRLVRDIDKLFAGRINLPNKERAAAIAMHAVLVERHLQRRLP